MATRSFQSVSPSNWSVRTKHEPAAEGGGGGGEGGRGRGRGGGGEGEGGRGRESKEWMIDVMTYYILIISRGREKSYRFSLWF